MTTPAQKRANQRQDEKRKALKRLQLSAEAHEVIDTNRRDGESASRCASRLITSSRVIYHQVMGRAKRTGKVIVEIEK